MPHTWECLQVGSHSPLPPVSYRSPVPWRAAKGMETLTETTAAATAVRVEAGVSALACLSGHGSQEFWGQLVDLAWLHNLRILNSHSRNQLPLSPCIVYIHL